MAGPEGMGRMDTGGGGRRTGNGPGGTPGEAPGDVPGDGAAPARSEGFSQARSAQAQALLEDYTEMIDDLTRDMGEARITDIARLMGVTHPTATKAVARLKREGLAFARPYRGVFLTGAGTAMAERVRARHRVVVDVLCAIGVPAEAAEIDAEGIEHHVSETTLAAFESCLARRA
jgi:DtxR family manganese transport transcriptional regulator